MSPTDDTAWMQTALRLAHRQLGRVAPNPAVGCVIVRDGQIIAASNTASGGRPHAETQALADAGDAARGATLYVTLEPCSHHGKTPPCADAIIQSGIARVVIGWTDPNPEVNGKGIEKLRAAGLEVTQGVCEQQARELNAGFFSVVAGGSPLVSLKLATSADGMIARADGTSKWITGEQARSFGHLLRAQHDAILTGMGTVEKDDPALTCRLPGREADSPVRIVADPQLRISPDSQLVKTARETPLWILTSATAQIRNPLENAGVEIIEVELRDGQIDFAQALPILAKRGITRLLVEGGQKLSTAFLQQGLVHDLYWFRAPDMIGTDGLAAIGPQGQPALAAAAKAPQRRIILGADVLEQYRVKPCLPAS